MTDHDGDPGIAWGEANAANDDGEAVMRAEREACKADAQITELVKQWPPAIGTARKAVQDARLILAELMRLDVEMFDGSAGNEAEQALTGAAHQLHSAEAIARDRLKLVEDAEKDAELARLRAENKALKLALAGTCEGGC